MPDNNTDTSTDDRYNSDETADRWTYLPVSAIHSVQIKRDRDKTTTNANPSNGDIQVNKEQLVNWLTTNCDCWKGDKDKDTLNTFTEQKLTQLKDAAEKAKRREEVANAAEKGFTANGASFTYDPTVSKWNSVPAITIGSDIATPASVPITPTTNSQTTPATQPTTPKMTLTDMLKTATPEEQAVWNYAQRVTQERKTLLISALTATAPNDASRAAAVSVYNAMQPEQLEALYATMPKPQHQHQFAPGTIALPSQPGQPIGNYYVGPGGNPIPYTPPATPDNLEGFPVPPVINWQEEYEAYNKKAS